MSVLNDIFLLLSFFGLLFTLVTVGFTALGHFNQGLFVTHQPNTSDRPPNDDSPDKSNLKNAQESHQAPEPEQVTPGAPEDAAEPMQTAPLADHLYHDGERSQGFSTDPALINRAVRIIRIPSLRLDTVRHRRNISDLTTAVNSPTSPASPSNNVQDLQSLVKEQQKLREGQQKEILDLKDGAVALRGKVASRDQTINDLQEKLDATKDQDARIAELEEENAELEITIAETKATANVS